jgi:hypothetical protein
MRNNQPNDGRRDQTARGKKRQRASTYQIRIKAAWGKQIPCILETGRLLIEAKAKLVPYGKWGKMFEGADRLPFGQETARCLMRIAKHPLLSDSKNTWILPPSWWTLFILSRMPMASLKAWLADGTINAKTASNAAKALYPAWERPLPHTWPKNIQDPEGTPHVIEAVDLSLCGASAERSAMLKKLESIGYNMGDVRGELADIDAGAEETTIKAPRDDVGQVLQVALERDVDALELAKARGDIRIDDASFERWVLRVIFRMRRLLDKL